MSGRPSSGALAGAVRSRRLVHAGFAGVGGRMATVLLAVLVTPVIVRSLGAERYGVYATVTMMTSLLAFTDLGAGSALVTRLAAAEGRGDWALQRRLVSAAFAMLSVLAVAVGTLAFLGSRMLPWSALLGGGSVPVAELERAVLWFGVCFACGLPVSLGQKALLGLQRGAHASVWLLGSTALALSSTAVVAASGASLVGVVVATTGSPALMGTIQLVVLFRRERPDLLPSLRAVRVSDVRSLGGVGGLFLVLSVAGAVAFRTDLLVVSAILGPAAAGVFAIAMRLFGLLTMAVGAMFAQLWPAFAEALARGDHAWVRRTFARSVCAIAAVCTPVVTLMTVFGQEVVRVWVGAALVPPTALLVAMAAWTLLQCCLVPVASLMNGAEIVRFQVIAASCMAAANVAASIVFTGWFGMAGPVWASVLTHALLNGGPAMVLVYRRFLRSPVSTSAVSTTVRP